MFNIDIKVTSKQVLCSGSDICMFVSIEMVGNKYINNMIKNYVHQMSKKIRNLFKLQWYIHRETSNEHNLSYNLILNFIRWLELTNCIFKLDLWILKWTLTSTFWALTFDTTSIDWYTHYW